MGHVRPFILSEDAKSQADFYTKTLGGVISSVLTHGQTGETRQELQDKVMHLCLEMEDGSSIFMADSVEPFTQGSGLLLNISYKAESQAREAFDRLASSGQVKVPFAQKPFGLFYGEITDSYGVTWMITA
ncbi:VOC family protein [Paenibacillus chibensis]|uniref:VOC family protein n=1 Tax=Paenibacillus chibensis TaxID=59846 RepID=UPI0013E3BC40|nr:VOC family protein [Paenibacillus chibensis]MEC0370642.1 VOC family protein [Paenibacillus chibensis]